jgi:hypothetical protein
MNMPPAGRHDGAGKHVGAVHRLVEAELRPSLPTMAELDVPRSIPRYMVTPYSP